MDDFVLVRDWMQAVGMDDPKSALLFLQKQGIEVVLARHPEKTRNKAMRVITPSDAERATRLRRELGFPMPGETPGWKVLSKPKRKPEQE